MAGVLGRRLGTLSHLPVHQYKAPVRAFSHRGGDIESTATTVGISTQEHGGTAAAFLLPIRRLGAGGEWPIARSTAGRGAADSDSLGQAGGLCIRFCEFW